MTYVGQDQIQCLSGKSDLVKTHLFQDVQLLCDTTHDGFGLVPHTTSQGCNHIIETLDVEGLRSMPSSCKVLGLVNLEGTKSEVAHGP